MSTSSFLVAVLGELGDLDESDTVFSPSSYTNTVVIKHIAWEKSFGTNIERIAQDLSGMDPTVICIGSDVPQDTGLELTKKIFGLSPTIEVIFISEPTASMWAQASRLGARDVVSPDANEDEFIGAISAAVRRGASVRSHVLATAAKSENLGSVIVVLSPKGGSGKTTVGVNVASAIAQRAPERTLLLDLDCQFGDVATTLGLEPERTLTDLGALSNFDSTELKLFLSRDQSGKLLVLPSSGTPEEADLIDELKANQIIEIARRDFDYIIIDTAAGIDERALAAINSATDLIFVASMDVTSVRNLIKELDLLERLGPSLQHRHFVLNRVDSVSGLKEKDIVEAVGLPISHSIDSSPSVIQHTNAGQPIVLAEPKSKVAKQLDAIAIAFLKDEDLPAEKRRIAWKGSK